MSTPALSSSPELQRQRHAIYTGLTSILSDDQAKAALESWAIYFNETGSVFNGLNAFARDVCASFDKAGQQRDLVKALNRALLSRDGTPTQARAAPAAAPLPAPVAAAQPAAGRPTGASVASAEFDSFSVLLLGLLGLLQQQHAELHTSTLAFLHEVTMHMPWSEIQQQQMLRLLQDGRTALSRSYRPDQLRSFMQHLHSWLGEELGKAPALALLRMALSDAEDTTAGIKYAPGNFV